MELLKWEQSYSVGVKKIDDQHKNLFEIINQLYECMREGSDKKILDKLLESLADYVVVHFSFEEKYFKKFNYKDKEYHIKQHKIYIKKINSFLKNFKDGKYYLSYNIIDFLEDWILSHVTGTDKNYTKCFNENGLH